MGRKAAMLFVAGLLVVLVGCSPYRLQGVVVAGEMPGVEVVNQNDPRLAGTGGGVAGASLVVLLDPERLSPKRVGEGHTDADGRFALPIDTFGAGALMLDIELRASRPGYLSVSERMQLPGGNQRVIITVLRGDDPQKFESDDILRDTLREAEPFLRD
ncbi:hypothetical protein [Algisphaera agarilytica]|uniref:hypothetical protein n=1 Tax=Algisphaera agarilytica TaxID=1385975 RepID=UPI001C86CBD0|nr:hypothetical protein [Algisphaera agarilytica]